MAIKNGSLADQVAKDILGMITIEKKFKLGDKLPNENDLAASLKVSRTTLREAIRILAAHDVLVIRRGKGTYVENNTNLNEEFGLKALPAVQLDVKDLYEIRLSFEPRSAYYAAKRATDKELAQIMHFGKLTEELTLKKLNRQEAERAFHKSIASATHNEFIKRLMPILYKAVDKGVNLAQRNDALLEQSLVDHRMVMDFLSKRDADGAETAMRLHIIHTMRGFGIQPE